MSISRTVYVRREKVPSPTAWSAAIRAAGFPLEIHTDFDVERLSGFLPCVYDGRSSGFEYFFSTVDQIREDNEDCVLPDVGERDIGIAFVTRSSTLGLATAAIAAAVLCEMTDGILHDEEADELVDAKNAMADARALLASLGNDLD